jgi:hypothetical protein
LAAPNAEWNGTCFSIGDPLEGIPVMRARTTARRLLALTLLLPMGLLGGLSLSACQTLGLLPAAAVAGTVEGVSLNQTGKTASDHLVSAITGEDCSVLRYTKNGKYCLTDAEIAQEQARLHRPYEGTCYHVRGNVACYDQADAAHSSETTVYQYQP